MTERRPSPKTAKGITILKIFRKIIKSGLEKIFKAIKSEKKNDKMPAKILVNTKIKKDFLKMY